MDISEELCMKFPAVLCDKLKNREICFPDGTYFEYSKLQVYRAIERRLDDYRPVTSDDFKSYYELNKNPKRMRGRTIDIKKDPQYYGVSSYVNKQIVEQLMKFPNPNKKMAVGYVYMEGGPQYKNSDHVCWWLYEGHQVSGFTIEK